MNERIYIFAETYEHAHKHIAEHELDPRYCVIVRDTSTIQGLKLNLGQMHAIGHWYNNHQVSLAYDFMLFDIKRRKQEDASYYRR